MCSLYAASKYYCNHFSISVWYRSSWLTRYSQQRPSHAGLGVRTEPPPRNSENTLFPELGLPFDCGCSKGFFPVDLYVIEHCCTCQTGIDCARKCVNTIHIHAVLSVYFESVSCYIYIHAQPASRRQFLFVSVTFRLH